MKNNSDYQRWVHRFGISTSFALLAAMVGFPVTAGLVYGIWPDFHALWPGFVAVVLFMAPYLPSETIGYMSGPVPVLHHGKRDKPADAGDYRHHQCPGH